MRIRAAFLAATIAALPILAMAQTVAPSATVPPAATAPAKPHHERGEHRKQHAAVKAAYEKLNAADKAKFDGLTQQMKDLRQQRMQILGISKS
jgi:hypothetical protein